MSVNNLEASVDEQLESAEGSYARAEHIDTYITGQTKSKGVYEFFKRAFDIVCSFLAFVVLSPVLLLVAVIIMIDDFGNPFFIQDRVGKNGQIFRMLKFRTMYKDAEARKSELIQDNESDGVHFKIKKDPRITRIGGFLRKTSIDELPQLLNVMAGHMSIIGPRPFIKSEQALLPDDRLAVRPGLSCYWQLENTCDMPIEEQLELDYKYIRERSFSTDIKIIFKTVIVVFKGKNW